MDLEIRALTREELAYAYAPSPLIEMATSHIGRLRVDFDTNGKGFFTTWNDSLPEFKTEEFQKNFGEVVDWLRKDTSHGQLLQNRESLRKWTYAHSEMGIGEDTYGMRVNSEQYSYICRLDPRKGVYNGYIYCYYKEALDDYLKNCQRGIHYTEENPYKRVALPHGATLEIQDTKGVTMPVTCQYYGDTNMLVTQGLHEEVVNIDQYFQDLRDRGMTYSRELGIYTEQDLTQKSGTYAIYQLPQGEKYHPYRFTGIDMLGKMELDPLTREDYNLVYVGAIQGNEEKRILNQLYERFNMKHPVDFTGHSLSVSDVIAINLEGKTSYHYVDSIGFQRIPFANHLSPKKENSANKLVDLAKNDLEGLVNALSTAENRLALERAVHIATLKSNLYQDVPFVDLISLNDYCQDTWLKVDGIELGDIHDFVVEALNWNYATPEKIMSLPHRLFGEAVLEEDLESLPFATQLPTEHIKVEGHIGTWSVIESEEIDGTNYRLLEHDDYGGDVAGAFIDDSGKLILDGAWNGFDDLKYFLESQKIEQVTEKMSIMDKIQAKIPISEKTNSAPTKDKEMER